MEGAKRRNTGRGTSAIDDAAQSKFVLTAEKGGPVQVSHEKTRELPSPLDDFWFRIENDVDAVRLVHLNREQVDRHVAAQEADKEAGKVQKAMEAIRAALGRYAGRFHGTRTEFLDLLDGDRNALSKAFTVLKAEGAIQVSGGHGQRVIGMTV